MDDDNPLLAIPVLRTRVAPVFNWCSRVRIFSGGGPAPIHFHEEMDLGQLTAFNRLETLRRRGVRVLICGALSPDLLAYGEQIGLSIIAGVAGEIDEVVHAFGSRELDQPRFWLPGCRGPRRYRGGGPGAGGMCRRGRKAGGSPGGPCEAGPGVEDLCRCPACGAALPPQREISEVQRRCPHCGLAMMRGQGKVQV